MSEERQTFTIESGADWLNSGSQIPIASRYVYEKQTHKATGDLAWARKITERLRLQATNYAEAREKVVATLVEARDGGAADLLGYKSWTAYMADVLGDAPLRLERDARQELVAELSTAGMSTRAIAPIVGVSQKTVDREARSARESFDSPEPVQPMPSPAPKSGPVETIRFDTETGEVIEDAASTEPDPAPRPVTGLDGKEYKRPEPRPTRRRPIVDQARDAGLDLRKAAERIERLRGDDRFPGNKNEVATRVRSHLMYVIETCQGLLDDLDQSQED